MIDRSIFFSLVLILTGCSSQRKEPPAPVVYGVEHKQEAKASFSIPFSSSIDPPIEMISKPQEKQIVVVEAHDTLDSIAERYQVDRDTLIRQNQLMSPYYLFPGQNLELPTDAHLRSSPSIKAQPLNQKPAEFIEAEISQEDDPLKSEKLTTQRKKVQTIAEREEELEKKFSQLEADLKLSSVSSNKNDARDKEQERILPLKKPSVVRSTPENLSFRKTEKSIDSQTSDLEEPQATEVSLSDDEEVLKEVKEKKDSNLQQSSIKTSQNKVLKFSSPLAGNFRDHILSDFSQKEGRVKNDGLNIAAPQNTPIMAAEKGKVVYAGNEMPDFGNLVLLKHEGGWMTAYGYCAKICVELKQMVQKGQVIALAGKTGSVRETQLYFQLRKFDPEEKKPIVVDPKLYLE